MDKILKLEDLGENSTPCEICVAMNSRDVVDVSGTGDYSYQDTCSYKIENRNGVVAGNGCTDADRALIKLSYLNLIK